jgi:hypothetical protein
MRGTSSHSTGELAQVGDALCDRSLKHAYYWLANRLRYDHRKAMAPAQGENSSRRDRDRRPIVGTNREEREIEAKHLRMQANTLGLHRR